MYIDAFKVFCDLVETNSFSKAAALNDLTQSAVSQQIRNIEIRLGCKLVERAGRSISLSPEGQAFLRACRAMIRSWENLKGELSDLKNEVAGRLRIASIYSIGLHELPPRLKRFQDEFPDVEVQVAYKRSAQVYELVERGEADMGLVAFPSRRGGLVHEIFDEDRLVLICHPKHTLASKKRIALSELGGEPFVGFEPDTPTRKGIDRQLREAGVKVAHAADFDNVEMVKRAVEIESGVSIVPWTTVQAEVESGQLAAIEIDTPHMSRPLGLLLKKGRTRPAGLKELIAILKSPRKG
jgi:LysR family transcriptional regulator, transcriptional activator of the cysJI operon